MPFIQINGVKTWYEVSGAGRPIVFIHGAFVSSKVWLRQVPFFVKHGFQVITYDMRGMGKSAVSPHAYTVNDLARDTERLCKELKLQEPILCGQSLGACVTLQVAARRQLKTASIIVADGICDVSSDLDIFLVKRMLPKASLQLLLRITPARFWLNIMFKLLALRQPTGEWVRKYSAERIKEMAGQMQRRAVLQLVDAMYRLKKIEVENIITPMLVLHGGNESPFFTRQSKLMLERSKGEAAEIVMPGIGHDANEMQAAEFNQKVLDYLSR